MTTAGEPEDYLQRQVETAVLGGYLGEKEILTLIEELSEEDAEPAVLESLRALARRLLDERLEEEARWTGPTMNDRIDRAFDELIRNGILALQNAGYTLSDGWGEVITAAQYRYENVRGATFFHGQDVERGVLDQGLMLAFGALDGDFAPAEEGEASLAIAREVRETLARHGVTTEWNGAADTRIRIPPFAWRKRRWTPPPGERVRRRGAEEAPARLSIERVLDGVTRERGISREDAIAALKDFVCEEARKHYGARFLFEAFHEPEADRVDLYRGLTVVERHTDADSAVNERTLDQLGPLAEHVEPGDELVFQVFYREEDQAEAKAQDDQYGQILDMWTFRRPMKLSVRAIRDGILRHLP